MAQGKRKQKGLSAHSSSSNNAAFRKLGTAALCIGGAFALFYYLTSRDSYEVPQQTLPQHTSSSTDSLAGLERITFEDAKRAVIMKQPSSERVVQRYLDQLLKEKDLHNNGNRGWNSFAKFIYDPNFEKKKAEFKKRGLQYSDNNYGGKRLASTLSFKEGDLANVHIGSFLFKFTTTQDEVLSALDNEAFHAYNMHTSKIHANIHYVIHDRESDVVIKELLSYDLQFKMIIQGHRIVSKKFLISCYKPARALFKELEKIAEEDTPRSESAKIVYNALLARPTFEFFVAKEERASKKPYLISNTPQDN